MALENNLNYFANQEHYKNYCLKNLRDRYSINDVPERIKDVFINIYNLSIDDKNKERLIELDFWVPACYLTYRVLYKQYKSQEDLFLEITKTINLFQELIVCKITEEEIEKHIFKLPKRHSSVDYDFIKYSHLVDNEFCTTIPEEAKDVIRGKSGIYKLYDKKRTLIYIGKSINLPDRIPSSARERGAYYFSVFVCDNIAHMNILEPYLIAIFEPKLNSEHKTTDKPLFEIPIPSESVIFKLLK